MSTGSRSENASSPAESALLVGPYRLGREIGRGGMGRVFEAWRDDGAFRKRVAVKVAHHSLGNEDRLRRFRGERQILAQLEHPGIARILDGGTAETGEPYLVMEYVEGLPIDVYCERHGLKVEERLELFLKVCDAVHHAHEQQIVHRDIKPSNLLVNADGEPKLLDFGIAKLLEEEDFPVTVAPTRTGQFVATPQYASPEQLLGRPISPASDVYSLGVLLCQILTGQLPYRVTSGSYVDYVRAVVTGDPQRPSTLVGTSRIGKAGRSLRPAGWQRRLKGDLDKIVLTALRREPSRRYRTVQALSDDLRRHLSALPVSASGDSLFYRGRRWVQRHPAWTAAIVTLAAAVAFEVVRTRKLAPPPVAVEVRPSVAVLGIEDRSGDTGLASALMELLTAELAVDGGLRLVDADQVELARRDLMLPESDELGAPALEAVRRRLGVDHVATGSILADPEDRLRLRLELEGPSGTPFLLTVDGTAPELADLAARASARLRNRLGLPEAGSAARSALGTVWSAAPEAVRLYAEGRESLRRRDPEGARGLLDAAVEADPSFAQAYVALSEAQGQLDHEVEAAAAARRALELASGLAPELRLGIEARYYETARVWSKAVESWKALWTLHPDDVDYGLRLAAAQIASGEAYGASATLEALRSRPPPASEDPRVELLEARAAFKSAEFSRCALAAGEAVRLGRLRQGRSLVAEALLQEGAALRLMARYEAAEESWKQAREAFAGLGDRGGEARVLRSLGVLYTTRFELRQAEESYRAALAIEQQLGSPRHVAPLLNQLAGAVFALGRLEEAADLAERARVLAFELGIAGAKGRALMVLSSVSLASGHPAAAERQVRMALSIFKESGDWILGSYCRLQAARITLLRGDPASARAQIEGWRGERPREERPPDLRLTYLQDLAETALAMDDQAAAEAAWDDLSGVEPKSDPETIDAVRFQGLAELAMTRGDWPEAARNARRAVRGFNQRSLPVQQADAEGVFARALLGVGDLAGARRAVTRAGELLADIEDQRVRCRVGMADALYRAKSGEAASARERLAAIAREAEEMSYVLYQLEARLLLGELEAAAGLSSEAEGTGRFRLRRVATEAAGHGFAAIARRATEPTSADPPPDR